MISENQVNQIIQPDMNYYSDRVVNLLDRPELDNRAAIEPEKEGENCSDTMLTRLVVGTDDNC